jgi:Ca2+-binding RTX toxin-like protein/subtilisin-like proprotein convertase family protein
MPLPTDPMLGQQWHLGNTGGLLDLNVRGAWNPAQGAAYTGAGIRVLVIDDGFDYNHVDLAPNYDTGLDYDFDGVDLDPFGNPGDAHGTAVMGIIGADDNNTGVVGIAFDASLVGYRTHGFISDFWLQNIRDAIHHAAVSAQADVTNISQGIANDETSEFGAGYNAVRFDEIETSIGTAVNQGRGGLGMTIVKSAGNSRSDNFDVNADDWTNDTRQVVVSAVDQNGFVSSYSSYGSALLVSGFGTPGQVVTTDRSGAAGYNVTDYTSTFNGTSSAAPMVTGVVALMYDANAGLGWRDVQTILANSARQVGSEVGAGTAGFERYAWGFNAAQTWNGGGLHFSNDYGYGLVDATAAVRLAETWLLGGAPAQTTGNEFTNTMDMLNAAVVIPDGNATGTSFTGTAGFDDFVERVTVTVTFSTTFLADLELYIISPDGTVSELIDDVAAAEDFNGTWTFETQAFRGERAQGTWTVRIVDDAGADVLTVSDIVVRTYGVFSSEDRYIFTNEYSDYAGLFGHVVNVSDANGGTDTVNASAVSSASTIRLDGAASSIDGVSVTFANIENAIGGDGSDRLYGDSSGNSLWGMRGNDTMDGGNGTDALYGGDGDDRLSQNFGGPDETLDGGDGNDTGDWSYDTFNQWVINLAAGTADIGAVTYAHLTSIENVIAGQSHDTVTGNASANLLNGQRGNDFLDGGSATDTLLGGSGNDTLSQGFGGPNEIMNGGSGNDTGDWSYSLGDSWVIDLPSGTAKIGGVTYAQLTSIENVVGGQTGDRINGSNGVNILDGQGGNDTISGGNGNDKLLGGLGNDTLNGGENDDELRGQAGDDRLVGGGGSDRYYIDSAGDVVVENGGAGLTGGNDTVYTLVNHTLTGDVEILRMQGADGLTGTGNGLNNRLFGNGGANLLRGLNGNDTLEGKDGADTLSGGAGNDTMTGGSQADVFRFSMNNTGADRIEDFNKNADRFQLSGGSFSNLVIAGADTILTHNGGTIRIVGVSNLTLNQWNALVIPGGESIGEAIAFDIAGALSMPPDSIGFARAFHDDWMLS